MKKFLIVSKNNLIFSIIISFLILLFSSSHTASLTPDKYQTKAYINKEYFIILVNLNINIFLMTEIVELNFSNDGTFSLKSDLFDEPAYGTYEKNFLLIKGEGETVRFIDETLGEMEMSYDFVGLPIGFQSFFILGNGSRDFTFIEDNETEIFTSQFIFMGPGF